MPKSIVDNVLATLSKALRQLQAEVEHLARQIARVDQFLSSSRRRVRKGPRKPSKASRRGGKHRISAAGRARMAAAQRKRRAKVKAAKRVAAPAKTVSVPKAGTARRTRSAKQVGAAVRSEGGQEGMSLPALQ